MVKLNADTMKRYENWQLDITSGLDRFEAKLGNGILSYNVMLRIWSEIKSKNERFLRASAFLDSYRSDQSVVVLLEKSAHVSERVREIETALDEIKNDVEGKRKVAKDPSGFGTFFVWGGVENLEAKTFGEWADWARRRLSLIEVKMPSMPKGGPRQSREERGVLAELETQADQIKKFITNYRTGPAGCRQCKSVNSIKEYILRLRAKILEM
ncbi:MAG: hypothetical protein FWD33_00710 [Alphaproteobacteria bacterium]|nr:hypothetical protein [Alphaproteobacteria bacterium]